MEIKNKKLDDLFNVMENTEIHRGPVFIPDGIINENEYGKAKHKILFLNKEAYTDDVEFDLREYLNKPPEEISDMWKRVGALAYCIFNISEIKNSFPTLSEALLEKNWYNSLKKVATMNIKKSNGKSTSDDNDLWIYAERDSVNLKEEIKIINPDIIICGGVGHILSDPTINLFSFKNNIFEGIYEDIDLISKKVIIADHFHPASRYGKEIYYYTFAAIWFKYWSEFRK